MRLVGRLVGLVVLAIAVPVALPAGIAPTHAESTCDGVWVVVDARAAGGSLTTRCAAGDPATGFAALEQTGFAYTFVPRVPGMVCTIDARPEPCNGAPPDAYWSYWHAAAGGSWTYATSGAGTREPAPGSVEGWRFGDGTSPPGTAPPSSAPEPAPEPAPAPPATSDAVDDTATTSDPSPRSTTAAREDPDSSSTTTTTTTTGNGPSRDSTDGASRPDHTLDEADDASTAEATPDAPDDEGAPPGPSWQPAPAATGEWSDPPPTTADAPATSTEQAPVASNEEAPVASGTPADEQEVTLAARRSPTPASDSRWGAVLGTGLLVGIAALTWRQQRRRAGARA